MHGLGRRHGSDDLQHREDVERWSAVEVVLQESPQLQSALVHREAVGVCKFGVFRKNSRFSFREGADDHMQRGVYLHIQTLVTHALLGIRVGELVVDAPLILKVIEGFTGGPIVPTNMILNLLGQQLEETGLLSVAEFPGCDFLHVALADCLDDVGHSFAINLLLQFTRLITLGLIASSAARMVSSSATMAIGYGQRGDTQELWRGAFAMT